MAGSVGDGVIDHPGLGRGVFAQAEVDDPGPVVDSIIDARGHILVVLVAIGTHPDHHDAGLGEDARIAHVGGLSGYDAGHKGAMVTTVDGERVVAIVAVGGVVHVVAHEQPLVLVVLNAPDAALHEPVVGALAREVVSPLRGQRRAVEVGGHGLEQRVPTAVTDRQGDEAAKRQRIGSHRGHGLDDAVDGGQRLLLLHRNLVEHQVAVNLGLAPHHCIIGIFRPVGGGHPGGVPDVLVFRVEALELTVLLSAGTYHIETAVARAKEVPAVEVVDVSVAVVVAAVGLFLRIGPQGLGHRHARRVDAGIDDTDDNRLARLEMTGKNILVEANDVGTFQRVVVLLMPPGINIITTGRMRRRKGAYPPHATQG